MNQTKQLMERLMHQPVRYQMRVPLHHEPQTSEERTQDLESLECAALAASVNLLSKTQQAQLEVRYAASEVPLIRMLRQTDAKNLYLRLLWYFLDPNLPNLVVQHNQQDFQILMVHQGGVLSVLWEVQGKRHCVLRPGNMESLDRFDLDQVQYRFRHQMALSHYWNRLTELEELVRKRGMRVVEVLHE